MRIVAGTFRGRRLVAPKGQSTRPTADRTRQAFFNVLEHAPWSAPLAGARVIDLFAGSGALGLEALSRGAAFCLFVETAPDARAAIAANIAALDLSSRTRLLAADAARLGQRNDDAFEIAFLDPPYGSGLAEAALAAMASGAWLRQGALAIVEGGREDPSPEVAAFRRIDDRLWGAARVSFLKLETV